MEKRETEVHIQKFRRNDGVVSMHRIVGYINHFTNLDDTTPEVVELHISSDYSGEKLRLPDSDKIHPLGERELHCLFPRFWFEAPTQTKLMFKMGSVVQKIVDMVPLKSNRYPVACFYLSIDMPSDDPNFCIRYPMQLPEINLKHKVLHIPEFDLFVTAESNDMSFSEKLSYIRSEQCDEVETPLSLKIKSNQHDAPDVWYSLNGLPVRKLKHETDVFVNNPIIELTLDSGETLIKDIDFPFTETATLTWSSSGGIVLRLDTDKDRVIKSVTNEPLHTNTEINQIIEELRKEVHEQSNLIEELNKLIKQKENTILHLNGKLAEATSEAKKMQDEYKTRREEVRYHSTKHDAESSLVLDTIKVVGALAGFGALLLTLFKKSSKESISKLVEWGVPSFGFSSKAFTSSISTTTLVGGFVVVGLVIAVIANSDTAVNFISNIYNNAKERVLGFVGDGVVGTIVSAVCSAVETVANVTVSVVRKATELVCDVVGYVGSAITSCASFVGGLFSW